MKSFKRIFNPDKLSTLLLYTSILTFIISFNFAHNPSGGWYQQFLPSLNGRPLVDITFTDSLTGYAIVSNVQAVDTSFIIKTTDGGDNWNVILSEYRVSYYRVIFLNNDTGYVGGSTLMGGFPYLLKTTNGGINWNSLNTPGNFRINDMSILNEDSIWITDENGFNGGIFRTTDAGMNWTRQIANSGLNKIYMFDRNIGFASTTSFLFKTTNSGINWNVVPGQNGFRDIYFADSLTGWKSYDSMRMTTDGGMTWMRQNIVNSNNFFMFGTILSFSNIGRDTIWGVGFRIEYPNLQIRSIVHRTTNGGINWFYQIPDTSFRLPLLTKSDFINSLIGWGYASYRNIHTVTGGDSIFYNITSIYENNNYINPNFFELYQNYPNPFNPATKIRYELQIASDVKLKIIDIRGKEIRILVNQKKSSGKYEVDFNGNNYSSGIYFYRLEVSNSKGNFNDTKKMLLVK